MVQLSKITRKTSKKQLNDPLVSINTKAAANFQLSETEFTAPLPNNFIPKIFHQWVIRDDPAVRNPHRPGGIDCYSNHRRKVVVPEHKSLKEYGQETYLTGNLTLQSA